MRGRLFIAGIGDDTDLGDACDVLTVVLMDTPGEALQRWRDRMDRAAIAAQAKAGRLDRATWGLQPEQIEQQRRAMDHLTGGR